MSLRFEWHPEKEQQNQHKHNVSFTEASTIFADLLSTTVFDPDHSDEENRYITIGFSIRNRLLIIAHTDRDNRIRIISARELTTLEKKEYEEEF